MYQISLISIFVASIVAFSGWMFYWHRQWRLQRCHAQRRRQRAYPRYSGIRPDSVFAQSEEAPPPRPPRARTSRVNAPSIAMWLEGFSVLLGQPGSPGVEAKARLRQILDRR